MSYNALIMNEDVHFIDISSKIDPVNRNYHTYYLNKVMDDFNVSKQEVFCREHKKTEIYSM